MPEKSRPHEAARLLFLHAQTSLHPGSGTALGAVDLPVQRERHTQWPNIPGSALKGILRDRCREAARGRHEGSRKKANETDAALLAAFGPGKVEESNSYAGALSITDARILAFPVRSLRGVFAWVTCGAVLERLNRDLHVAGVPRLALPPEVQDTDALCAAACPLIVEENKVPKVVLEEFEFTVKGNADGVARWFAGQISADPGTRERLPGCLVVLSDNYFTHFVRNATEIVARVGLDYDTKTVKEGALFYQEFLPPETIFYALVLATGSRLQNYDKNAAEMMDYLATHLPEGAVLQIGGDETTGKGLCLAHLSNGKGT